MRHMLRLLVNWRLFRWSVLTGAYSAFRLGGRFQYQGEGKELEGIEDRFQTNQLFFISVYLCNIRLRSQIYMGGGAFAPEILRGGTGTCPLCPHPWIRPCVLTQRNNTKTFWTYMEKENFKRDLTEYPVILARSTHSSWAGKDYGTPRYWIKCSEVKQN